MKRTPFVPVILSVFLVCVTGCSELDDVDDPDAGDSDVHEYFDADESDTDIDADADSDSDADVPDADPTGCPAPPAVTLGDTPTAEEWKVDASRCGQPSFSVFEDQSLGDIVEYGQQSNLAASQLQALAEAEGLVPPREFQYDTRTRIFTYLTQDRGEFIEASALIAHPVTDDPDFEPGAPILFLHGTTGFTDECAPSAMLEVRLLAAVIASMGYTVIAPDFIGLKSMGDPTGFLHPYLVGQPTVISSLDALRAFYKLPSEERGGYCYPHDYVSLGGSQGGHAALWLDRLATTYAPEYEHLGSVATVPPADLVGQATQNALVSATSATRNTIAFLGAASSWYGLEDRLDEVFLEPFDTSVPQILGEGCSFGGITSQYDELEDLFTPELLDSVADGDGIPEPWNCMVGHNGLVTTDVDRHGPFVDSYSIHFITGEDDDLVDTSIERESFLTLCDQGLPLSYLECAGGPHGATTAWALPEIMDFVDDRRARVIPDAASQCELSEPVVCEATPPD